MSESASAGACGCDLRSRGLTRARAEPPGPVRPWQRARWCCWGTKARFQFGTTVLALLLPLLGAAESAIVPACSAPHHLLDADEYECFLRSGNITVQIQRSRAYVNINCEKGGFQCEELQPLSELRNETLPKLSLDGCPLPADGIGCTLQRLGASGVTRLWLHRVPGGALLALRPEHLAGLALHQLNIREWESRAPALSPAPPPIAALGAAPALINLTIESAPLRLEPDAFVGAPPLERLELLGCGLTELPTGAFRGLSHLRRLVIFRNNITRVSGAAFEGLVLLEELELGASGVRYLEPDAFVMTRRLRTLVLVDNFLAELHSNLFKGLEHLEQVRVRNNVELSVQARALAELPVLRRVQLEWCRLRTLPEDSLTGSTALQYLSLAHNRLKRLPRDLLRDQRNLHTLDLSNNLLEELSDGTFSGLSSVERLDVSHNLLVHVTHSAFLGAGRLQELVLSHNALTLASASGEYAAWLASASPLATLVTLRRLDLAHNRVSSIFDDWLYSMTELQHIDLSYNAFAYLLNTDLNFSQDNITVDLRHNNITEIVMSPATVELNRTNEVKVLLDNNQIQCGCHLYSFLLWERSGGPSDRRPALESAFCAAPHALRGTDLRDIGLDVLQCTAEPCPPNCTCDNVPHLKRLRLTCTLLPSPDQIDLMLAAQTRTYTVSLRLVKASISLTVIHPRVLELNLSHLELTKIPPAAFRVSVLDLSSNRLAAIPRALLANTNTSLYLADNPLTCDCTHVEDVKALKKHKHLIKDYSSVNCSNGDLLGSKDATVLCDAWFESIIGGSLAALGLLAAIIVTVILLGRRHRSLSRLLGVGEDHDEEKLYDAFVSFSHLDHWFVVDNLVSKLESGPEPYKLCLHYRDWVGGEWVPTQIVNSVRDSRRTIIVLSENYLESRWSLMEFRAALECAMRDGRVRLVVVMLRDVTRDPRLGEDMRAYLSVHNYLMWGEDDFWSRLRNTLSPPALRTNKLTIPRLTATWLAPRTARSSAPAL